MASLIKIYWLCVTGAKWPLVALLGLVHILAQVRPKPATADPPLSKAERARQRVVQRIAPRAIESGSSDNLQPVAYYRRQRQWPGWREALRAQFRPRSTASENCRFEHGQAQKDHRARTSRTSGRIWVGLKLNSDLTRNGKEILTS